MTFEVNESIPLGRFVFDLGWTPVLGTYLQPLTYFAPDRSNDPNDYLVIERILALDDIDVAITRGGGLFVRDRGQYVKIDGRQRLADLLNLVLAEFAFQGLVSEPITYVDIQSAKLIGRHISITGGHGTNATRTWGAYGLLALRPRDVADTYLPPPTGSSTFWLPNYFWMPHDPTILDRIQGLQSAKVIAAKSESLPTLLVAAIYHASRQNLAETIISAWIVCEELLSFFWDEHVENVPDIGSRERVPNTIKMRIVNVPNKARRERLRDTRTYTAAVRAEILHSVGTLDADTYEVLNVARKARNELAHRAAARTESAAACVSAMRSMLRRIGLSTDRLPGYGYSLGGASAPTNGVEPAFDFR